MKLVIDQKGCDSAKIFIVPKVLNVWRKFRQTSWRDKEACGVLIGGYDAKENLIIVESCTEPMKCDIRRRHSFTLQDDGHQLAVDIAYNNSNGTSFYLGTWHSHPVQNPTPSFRDLSDWKKCVTRNPVIPSFMFAIVGTESVFLRTRLVDLSQRK